MSSKLELLVERGLFASRWLMAPFYIGLAAALIILLYNFASELVHLFLIFPELTQNDAILGVLSLIDLSLAGNLTLIVIFSGYENFVSKMDIANHEDQPEWMGTVDFSSLKLKLVTSMIGISGIHLLKVFMGISQATEFQVKWMVTIHLVFILSGLLLATMDYVSVKTKTSKIKF
jgi:uncharacterized protein (TIGR00645 family)